jgi:hypothetical protein
LPSIEASPSKIKQAPSYKAVQDPLAIDEKHNQKKAPAQNGRCSASGECLVF